MKLPTRVICAGDVTVGPPSPAIDKELAGLPGEKVLVVGNHQFVNNMEGVKDYHIETVYPTVSARRTHRCC